jgi:RNA polymerase sigma-70 factor, ECF subfamily
MSAGGHTNVTGACGTLARMLTDQPARLPRKLRSIVGDPAVAEDLAQEAVARAGGGLCNLRGGDDEALLCAWLDTIARNVAFNHLRAASRRPIHQPLEAGGEIDERTAAPASHADAGLLLADARHELIDALAALPPDLADVVTARLVHERSTADTARLLGIGEGLVKWRLHRARALLRAHLRAHDNRPNKET